MFRYHREIFAAYCIVGVLVFLFLAFLKLMQFHDYLLLYWAIGLPLFGILTIINSDRSKMVRGAAILLSILWFTNMSIHFGWVQISDYGNTGVDLFSGVGALGLCILFVLDA